MIFSITIEKAFHKIQHFHDKKTNKQKKPQQVRNGSKLPQPKNTICQKPIATIILNNNSSKIKNKVRLPTLINFSMVLEKSHQSNYARKGNKRQQ